MDRKQALNTEKLREKLKPILIETIEEIQESCGDDQEEEKMIITEDTIPIGGIKNFSSLRGVAVTKNFLFQKLRLDPDKVSLCTIFATKENIPRSLSEILDFLCNYKTLLKFYAFEE